MSRKEPFRHMAILLFFGIFLLSLPAEAIEWKVDGEDRFDGALILETTSRLGQKNVDIQATFFDSWPERISYSNDLVFTFGSSLVLRGSSDPSIVAKLDEDGLSRLRHGPQSGLTRLVLEKSRFGWSALKGDFVIPLSERRLSSDRQPALFQVGRRDDVSPSDLSSFDHLQLQVYGSESPHSDFVFREEMSSEPISEENLGPLETIHAHRSDYRVGVVCGKEITEENGDTEIEINLGSPHLKVLCIRLNDLGWWEKYRVHMRFRATEATKDGSSLRRPERRFFECTPQDLLSSSRNMSKFYDIFPGGDCVEKLETVRDGWSLRRGHFLKWESQVFLVPRNGNFPIFKMDGQDIALIQLPKIDWFDVKVIP